MLFQFKFQCTYLTHSKYIGSFLCDFVVANQKFKPYVKYFKQGLCCGNNRDMNKKSSAPEQFPVPLRNINFVPGSEQAEHVKTSNLALPSFILKNFFLHFPKFLNASIINITTPQIISKIYSKVVENSVSILSDEIPIVYL